MNANLCGNKEEFIKNLRHINQRAEVDPDIIDLLETFAGLRLERNKDVVFYDSDLIIKDKILLDFISKNKNLDSRVLNFLAAYFLEMKSRGLYCLFNPAHLANLLHTPLLQLIHLATGKANNYVRFFAAKRNGGVREILAPKPALKTVQRKILDNLLHRVPLNAHAEGFRKQRSIVSNAQRHIDKKIVIKMDVKDFFPTITYQRVLGLFKALGYSHRVSLLLADLTTYKGKLPTGAPTSPAISNIISRKMDKRFAKLGEKIGFDYSRYADDLAISSNNIKIIGMIPFFRQIMKEEGFEINESKIRILRSGTKQSVTGIVVNKKPNIDRREIKKIRAVIHNCQHKEIKEEIEKWARMEKKHPAPHKYSLREFRDSLLARINFIKMVNPVVGEKLLGQFNELPFRV
ncbi:MAG: reverse transcriptase family protein [Thermodesulfobacteriota bacterium]